MLRNVSQLLRALAAPDRHDNDKQPDAQPIRLTTSSDESCTHVEPPRRSESAASFDARCVVSIRHFRLCTVRRARERRPPTHAQDFSDTRRRLRHTNRCAGNVAYV
ncbi:hypothetical protein F01_170012 [Burkholderia cenocepacia]|nr:hypothetical protein F01_170012 [Burkholderia cenocepacia]